MLHVGRIVFFFFFLFTNVLKQTITKTSTMHMGVDLNINSLSSYFHFSTVSPIYLRLKREMNVFSQTIRKRAQTCQIKYVTSCVSPF